MGAVRASSDKSDEEDAPCSVEVSQGYHPWIQLLKSKENGSQFHHLMIIPLKGESHSIVTNNKYKQHILTSAQTLELKKDKYSRKQQVKSVGSSALSPLVT